MKTITIDVADGIAAARDRPKLICGKKYLLEFKFDSEWEIEAIKTARLTYNRNGQSNYNEVVFKGTSCEVVAPANVTEVSIGAYSADAHITTPARVECLKSILCGGGTHEEPPEDVYIQLLNLIDGSTTTGDIVLIDRKTKQKYTLYVSDGKLMLEKSEV